MQYSETGDGMTAGADKMSRITIINTPGLKNRGGMAVVMGALRGLRESFPEDHITVLCHHGEDWDALRGICERHGVELKRHPWFKEHKSRPVALLKSALPALVFLTGCILGRAAARMGLRRGPFQQSDVVLDLNADALHDNYAVFFPLWALANIMMAEVAGRPVVVWSAGIGAFRRRITRLAARVILDRVDVIMAREEVTREYLKSLGVNRPRVYVTADHAFLMDPVSAARTDEILAAEGIARGEGPLIGISASEQITGWAFPGVQDREKKYQRYLAVMTATADYLIGAMNATVVLIPHVVNPRNDDRIVSRRLYDHIQDKRGVRLLAGNYMADELKAIIGACDLFIGCRMHATIAATSMGVPTVAVVYGQKFHGIIGSMMGQADYVAEIGKCGPDELQAQLRAKIDSAWANREAIRRDLAERASAARQRAMMNGSLVRDMLQARRRAARADGT